MSDSEKTMLSAQIPRSLHDDLRRLAETHDRSISAETRAALRLHLRIANDVDGLSSSLGRSHPAAGAETSVVGQSSSPHGAGEGR
jgi:plasmid stability protein